MSLTWGAPASGATTYSIYNGAAAAVTGISGTTGTITGLTPSTAYTLAVTAVTAGGESPLSLPVYVSTPASGTLATPYSVSHGKYLTINNTGPWALQGVARGSETLQAVDITSDRRITTFTGFPQPPTWIPAGSYTLSNDPSNHGGTLAADTVIDGYTVPAGTWVAQFMDFSAGPSAIIEGNVSGASPAWPGILFRGCRMRAEWTAPGWASENAQSTGGITWFNYCDAGGIYDYYQQIPAATQACEVVWQMTHDNRMVFNRCYLSQSVTFLGLDSVNTTGDALIECYIEKQAAWYDPSGPNAGHYHYNVVSQSGKQVAWLLLRNNIAISPQPAAQPWYFPGTVIVQFAADDGAYPGTGTNIDSSSGYQIRDNFLGGCGYCFSFGVDKANTPSDVSNVVCTGNQLTTYYFRTFGQDGTSYKNCTFGVRGNVWSGNTYADDYGTGTWPATRSDPSGNGPLAGTPIGDPLTTITNTFTGGSDGTTITIGNSGGTSGTAFDGVGAGFGGTTTYSSAQTIHSALSGNMNLASSGTAYVQWGNSLTGGTAQPQVWFREYLYIPAIASFKNDVCACLPGAGFGCNLSVSSGAKLVFADSGGTARLTTTNSVPTNAWFRVEGYVIGDTSVGQMQLKLFLSPDSSTADETITTGLNINTGGLVATVRFGVDSQGGAGGAWQVYLDGLGASTSGYLGPISSAATSSLLLASFP